ncbi:unnamed protein product [Meganyctiphanes norvegica]|uniref:Uncharacterized protein n=1 Tax=Meganyctiphanes norvegica TaxID=48144 RepID=A0AAV2RR48_MEGNR
MEKIGPNKASPSPPPPYFMQTSPPAYNAYPSQPYSEQAALVDKCISEKGKHQPKMEIVMQNYAAESSPQQPQPPIPKDSSSKSTRQMHSSTPSSHGCVVDQCCCGCTLRTGSLIIGMLSLLEKSGGFI